jgi:hypothetical protein
MKMNNMQWGAAFRRELKALKVAYPGYDVAEAYRKKGYSPKQAAALQEWTARNRKQLDNLRKLA